MPSNLIQEKVRVHIPRIRTKSEARINLTGLFGKTVGRIRLYKVLEI